MATKAKQLYTETGYRALVEELDYLKNTRRAEVKEAIAVARSFGDLQIRPFRILTASLP